MNKMTISLFTRTPLHVGCGSSVGAIDLPVLRERATDLPVIPGSTLKGVLADLFLEKVNNEKWQRTKQGTALFGSEDTNEAKRGALLIGEMRLLAFPVRSAKGGFVWATSPLLLSRAEVPCSVNPEDMNGFGSEKVAFESTAFILEEYKVTRKGAIPEETLTKLEALCDIPFWKATLKDRLVILSDDMLTYFAKNACEIAHHNKVDDETGTVKDGALFSQENVPSEALFIGSIMAQEKSALAQLKEAIKNKRHLLQVGANATTGLGWCHVTMGEVK